MKTFAYTITDPLGIHARPAGELVKKAKEFQSEVLLEKDGQVANAKRIFAVMGLAVKQGQVVTLRVDGADETEAVDAIGKLLRESF